MYTVFAPRYSMIANILYFVASGQATMRDGEKSCFMTIIIISVCV